MKQLPYTVMTSRINNSNRATAWCQEQWGSRWSVTDNLSGRWSCFYRINLGQYEWNFETEQQALLFALRWVR